VRRTEKEIADRAEMEAIIRRCRVCRLAMVENGMPYVVPLNFGFADDTLYFHCASKGRKIDILKKNGAVCFEFDVDHELVKGEKACEWGMHYQSVIGFGTAVFVTDPADKRRALDVIMSHYTDSDAPFRYPDAEIKRTTVISVPIDHMTGKRSLAASS
jgi:nitroimidazol reductase NimA-like FMN-containing flavoprotein (pyridoxamine 5'-phosphate oxidase superfamily)